MNRQSFSLVRTTSLTIFAMLFGAGNLVLPLDVGMHAGSQTFWGLVGFIITGVLLPLLGLLAITAFKGDYRAFFGRLGYVPGTIIIAYSMMAIGPCIVMPRIVGLSHAMMLPFIPSVSLIPFTALFLSLVFLATYRPSKLLDLIGKFLSPLKIVSIVGIILIGLFWAGPAAMNDVSRSELFWDGFFRGYETLDLLATIFFGSIVINLLTTYAKGDEHVSLKNAVKIVGVSGCFAALLLGAVYVGMGILGACYGYGLEGCNRAELFSAISFRVVGDVGAALVALVVFLACFVTAVSLSAVVTDYVQHDLSRKKLSYAVSLAIVLVITGFFASFGIGEIFQKSLPFIVASYPIYIVITICNLLYALYGVQTIKIPTAIVALIAIAHFYGFSLF